MTIQELNRRRVATALVVENLGWMNVPTNPEERLKSDARYRLAVDANRRAESDYQTALAALSSEDLMTLAI